MNIPEDLRYSSDHEWVRLEGTRVRVGITDYAQDALGDVVFVDLPAVGAEVSVGGSLGEVESTKSVSEVYAPVAGVVVAVNPELSGAPEQLNADPYGDGWICEIEVAIGHNRHAARPGRLPRPDRGLSDQPGGVLPGTITEETNCRERLPWKTCSATIVGIATRRGQFLLVVRFRLPAESSEATITLQPVDDHGEAGEEESAVTLVEVPHVQGSWWSSVGQRWASATPSPTTSPGPASPRERHLLGRHHRVAAPRRTGPWTRRRSRDQRRGSLNGTYVNRERIETAVLSGGDEVQVGKFKLVYLVAGDE